MNRRVQFFLIPLFAATVVAPAQEREELSDDSVAVVASAQRENLSDDSAAGQTPASKPVSDLEAAVHICTGPRFYLPFINKDSTSGEGRQQFYKFAWTDACRQVERGQSILFDLVLTRRLGVL